MSSLVSACKRLSVLASVVAFSSLAVGQARFGIEGGEYPIVGALPGDQVFPDAALNVYGGYLVWQDNATDGDGYGISARHINRNLSGSLGVFRVNENGRGDQVAPQIALLTNGGAVVAWQSTVGNGNKVVIRFLKADGTFATSDISVSQRGLQQVTPVVTGLPNGNALVVWASGGLDGSMLGVFGRIFSPTGEAIGLEFQVNQTALYNQRTPDVVVLPNGNVIVVWISESLAGVTQNVDVTGVIDRTAGVEQFNANVLARLYSPNGEAAGGEIKINSGPGLCANPCVSPSPDGFLVAWSGKPTRITVALQLTDGWDIFTRPFGLDGAPKAAEARANSYTHNDQYAPKVGWLNGAHLVLWNSVNQDGSREGVVARLILANGEAATGEFRVNTATVGQQIHPTVVSNGSKDFLTLWSSYVPGGSRCDIFAQRYVASPSKAVAVPPTPYVSAISQSRLSITWAELSGYSGVQYQVYLDDSPTPINVATSRWTATGLAAGSSHTIRLGYRLEDGSQSPLSEAVTGSTWGEDGNFDGLPDDWQAAAWTQEQSAWPEVDADSDGDGASNVQEFLAGTDPTDAASVLRTAIISNAQGWRLQWNAQPGSIYQVQIKRDGVPWEDFGNARLAADKSDSIPIGAETNVAIFRIIRLR